MYALPMVKPDEGLTARPSRLTSQYITVQEMQLHMRVADAPQLRGRLPVVLVHGLSVSSRYLIPLAEALIGHATVYAPDLPGFGKSDKPRHIYTVAELADVLAAWMDTVGLEQAAFIGNSMGCQTIVNLALRHPERVDRAVLVGPTIDPSERTLPGLLVRGAQDMLHEPLSYWPTLARDYWIAGPRRTLQSLQYAIDDRIETKLPQVQAPMLVVRGGEDAIVSQQWAERVAALLPKGQLAVFPDEAHVVHYSAPDALMQVIKPFLQLA